MFDGWLVGWFVRLLTCAGVEYLKNGWRYRLSYSGAPIGNRISISNGHASNDAVWPKRSQGRVPDNFECKYLEHHYREAWFQRTISGKWHMENQMVTWLKCKMVTWQWFARWVLFLVIIIINTLCSTQLAYLHSLLKYHTPTRSLHSTNTNLLSVPHVRTTFASHGFSVAAPTVWNLLPSGIRDPSSTHTFRRLLKTHCFQQVFGSP